MTNFSSVLRPAAADIIVARPSLLEFYGLARRSIGRSADRPRRNAATAESHLPNRRPRYLASDKLRDESRRIARSRGFIGNSR